MSDKLTKEMLDALIQEALLQEDVPLSQLPAKLRAKVKKKYDDNDDEIKDKTKGLANNIAPDAKISVDDIALAFKDDDAEDIEAIDFLKTNLIGKPKKDFAKDIADASTRVGKSSIQTQDDPQSVFQFDISNAGMQDSTPTMSPALKNVFDTIGLYDDTLFGRIKKISDFSDNLIKASTDSTAADTLRSKGLLEFTRYVMVLDYLNTISKNVDAGAGAYLFETFLAALAGGNVAGKEQTGGGKMGGADFTFGNNPYARGSSKYLKSTSAASQAASGFEKREFVHYVVAIKVLDQGKAPKESSIDVEQILGFNIYYPILEVVKPKKQFQLYKAVGKGVEAVGDAIKTTDRVTLPRTNDYFIGQLKLVSVNGQKFRDVLDKAVNQIGGEFETAFKEFQSAFDSVAEAKESVGLYSTSGKQKDGDKAIEDLIAYKAALKSVFEKLATLDPQGRQYQAPTDTSKLDENKMTELDLMVENMVKQFIKGNLND